jgi:DNA-binding transcriptional regulator YiaG
MPNIAQVLKEEIARVSRKQSRAEVATLKRAVARHRSEIAALKRRLAELNGRLSAAQRGKATSPDAAAVANESSAARFSAKGLASHRKRLGLSAADLGKMFGVSGQTIYQWEAGRARPRTKHMPAVAALRKLGRRQAASVLAGLAT